MAILRYVAFLAEQPAKLVDFYHRFLGTEEIGRSPKAISLLPMASTILLSSGSARP
jgi:hypothetical protein